MKNFLAIYKKELKTYFVSPIAYIVISVFLVISGYFFYTITGFYNFMSQRWQSQPYGELSIIDGIFRPLFHNMNVILLLLLPLLTMRLFAEEKRSGTIELLFTYPLKDGEIIFGKFFSAMTVFLFLLILTLVQPFMISQYVRLDWGSIFAGYLGLVLLGVSFLALGIFVSSLTENQIVAAVITFGALLLFWILGWSSDFAGWRLGRILLQLSIIEHFGNFAKGVIDTQDVVFYLCFSTFFLYLTFGTLGSKKWRG